MNKYNKNNKKQTLMLKGSLIDILFERNQMGEPSMNHLHPSSEGKEKKKQFHDLSTGHSQAGGKQSNKVIRITQFNSSLFIGEDKMVHSSLSQSNSPSPNKNFSIKKIAEFKNKVILNAQKTMQIQLKKKDQEFNINLKPSSAKTSFAHKQPVNKAFVTTKCNINNELPSLDHLISSFKIEDQVFSKQCHAIKSLQFSNIFCNQALPFYMREQSKDMLAETHSSLKQQSPREESPSSIPNVDLFANLEQPGSQSPKRIYSPRKIHSKIIMQQKKYQENLQREKKEILQRKKQLNRNYGKPFNPPQNVSAQHYIIYQTDLKKVSYNPRANVKKEDQDTIDQRKMLLHSHKIIASANPRTVTQIASLTKIMTCIVALEVSKRFNIDISHEDITIGTFEQNIGGTSANIRKGEIYTVEQLLFGLMLPSGNDASLALAAWAGKKLLQHEESQTNTKEGHYMKRQSYNRFIIQMNTKATDLNMQKTRYANSHGLSNIDNKSCAFDLGILCQYAMNDVKFREIVSTKVYESHIRIENQEGIGEIEKNLSESKMTLMKKRSSLYDPSQGRMEQEEMKDAQVFEQVCPGVEEQIPDLPQNSPFTKPIRWQNSHLLLQNKADLYIGIKTGVTNTAGPCLASCIEVKGRRFVIIVLNSKSMKYRFKDTENLRKWLFDREGLKYKEKESESQYQN